MQNILEILKGLEIEVPEERQKELTAKVAENYKTVAEFNKKVTGLETERDNYKGQLETAQETLKGFEGVDLGTIQKDLADWKKKAEDAENTFKAQIAARDFSDALKAELNGVRFTSESAKKAVMSEIEAAGLKLHNGKIIGLNDLIDQIKERDASAFVDEKQEELEAGKARFTSRSEGGGKIYKSRDEIMNIKDASERQRAIAENINLFRREG